MIRFGITEERPPITKSLYDIPIRHIGWKMKLSKKIGLSRISSMIRMPYFSDAWLTQLMKRFFLQISWTLFRKRNWNSCALRFIPIQKPVQVASVPTKIAFMVYSWASCIDMPVPRVRTSVGTKKNDSIMIVNISRIGPLNSFYLSHFISKNRNSFRYVRMKTKMRSTTM